MNLTTLIMIAIACGDQETARRFELLCYKLLFFGFSAMSAFIVLDALYTKKDILLLVSEAICFLGLALYNRYKSNGGKSNFVIYVILIAMVVCFFAFI